MFRFGVDSDDEGSDALEKSKDTIKTNSVKTSFISIRNPFENHEEDAYDRVEFCDGKVVLKKTPWEPPESVDDDDDGDNAKMEGVDSTTTGGEVVAGIYEGGGKVWECAVDLVTYMAEMDDVFVGKRVLELGGGHCLPAVYAGKCGAKSVDVQDLNEEVLRNVTVKNFGMNVDAASCDVRYIVGDWKEVPQLLQGDAKYDFIFSTETTYRQADLMPLAKCILALLKRDTGVAFIAAKSYYFGTGGGLRLFEDELQKQASVMGIIVTVTCTKEFRDGMSNVREILRISTHQGLQKAEP